MYYSILFPINILINGNPNTIVPSHNNVIELTGVTAKTLKNYIFNKNKPSERTINTISSKLESFFKQIQDVEFDKELCKIALKSLSSKTIDHNVLKNIIVDKHFEYFQSVVFDTISIDLDIRKYAQANKVVRDKILNFKHLITYINNTKLPSYMLNNIKVDDYNQVLLVKSLAKSLILLQFDVIFYIASAFEVEYNNNYLKSFMGDKPLMTIFLHKIN